MKNKETSINNLIIAWIDKYIFRIASPSTMPWGYKYRFDYLITERRKKQK